jgi:predicted nucleic acid-binding protein
MIFDTDVLIVLSRREFVALSLVDSTSDRSLSIVTFMELMQGARSKVEMQEIQRFIRESDFTVLPLTEAIGDLAAALIEQHALSNGLRLEDALIAATARETGEVLVTGNLRHFRAIRNLTLQPYRPR